MRDSTAGPLARLDFPPRAASTCRPSRMPFTGDNVMKQQDRDSTGTIRVVVADDHPVVMVGITRMLDHEADITVTASACDPAMLGTVLARSSCDVLICDYAFDQAGAFDGLPLIECLKRSHPELRILMLTMHDDPALVRKLFGIGVRGFLCKANATFSRLAAAVRTVAADQRYIDPEVAVALSGAQLGFLSKQGEGRRATLTKREYEVVRMISRGMRVSEIARQVCRSVKTVSTQKASAMKKLAVRNDIELVVQFRGLEPGNQA
ncbi:DNA-binding response regulator [Burkholderia gladioli pv. gladioli]|nr:DNA-binding response regulator [Burkholderia gladioli pv. gladioli]AWY54967.1 DNA-binding response regulator [Burkholderia gladioli pv. gladioli]